MDKHQKAVLRYARREMGIVLPGPFFIWLLYLLVVAALLKYLL